MSEHDIKVDMGGGRQRTVPVDLPGNSNYSKQKQEKQEKKVEQVTTGEVVKRKKGVGYRIRNSMIGEGSEGVLQYVLVEVLIPAAKTMISDAVSQGIERLLFGDTRVRSRSDRPGGYISYNRVRRQSPATEYGVISQRGRAQHEFEEIILSSRGEAEEVLDRLRDLIKQYDVATVADFYELVGITGQFTDNQWGWYDLRSAVPRLVRGGYIITLPRTKPVE
jgi:hypothetical protein